MILYWYLNDIMLKNYDYSHCPVNHASLGYHPTPVIYTKDVRSSAPADEAIIVG